VINDFVSRLSNSLITAKSQQELLRMGTFFWLWRNEQSAPLSVQSLLLRFPWCLLNLEERQIIQMAMEGLGILANSRLQTLKIPHLQIEKLAGNHPKP
jgi:hypothetical protein